MMKKILAIAAVAVFLLVSVMPMVAADADDVYTVEKTVRSSAAVLKHATCVANKTTTVDNHTIFIYETGADDSMKAYISDPQKNTPGKSLTNITSGKSYEVYFYEDDYEIYKNFTMGSTETVLRPYGYNIFIDEAETGKLLISKIVSDQGEEKSYYYVIDNETADYRYSYVGVTANLDPSDSGYQVVGDRYSRSVLYYEMEMKLTIVHYTGSPTLYVGLCIVVVALVGATLFLCGRRPKL